MKPILAIGAGFVTAMGMFAGGVAVATTVLTAEPEGEPGRDVEVADVWSGEPRPVDTENQAFERVASIAPLDQASAEPEDRGAGQGGAESDGAARGGSASDVDPTTTSAISSDGEETSRREEAARLLVMDHVDWCSERYRSYRAESNSYQPYSGGRRECVSPYLEDAMAMMADEEGQYSGDDYADADEMAYQEVDASYEVENDGGGVAAIEGQFDRAPRDQMALGADHVRNCFSRYRSYRVEDNSYQPYGGGPRRQCE